MRLYYFDSALGCGIREASSLEDAKERVIREVGAGQYRYCKEATKDEIDHVKAMGGYVPETGKQKEATDAAT